MEDIFYFLPHLALLCPSYLGGQCGKGGFWGELAHTHTHPHLTHTVNSGLESSGQGHISPWDSCPETLLFLSGLFPFLSVG